MRMDPGAWLGSTPGVRSDAPTASRSPDHASWPTSAPSTARRIVSDRPLATSITETVEA